jgi:DNA-binding NtrC family response regulator
MAANNLMQAPEPQIPRATPLQGTGVRILVVEDEAPFARAVARRLEKAGHTVRIAATLALAEQALNEEESDLLLLDMRLPDGSGLDFLQRLRERLAPQTPVLAMSAYGELEDAVGAMKLGAADYLKKPIDLEELLLNVGKVLAHQAVSRQLDYSRTRESSGSEEPELLGRSEAASQLRTQLARIARLGAAEPAPTVLLLGETGTGKDLAARLIHRQSPRASRPFVHVDCAALPRELIESELFGHVKGAFTNAIADRTGLIEAAEDGVVFLDEIGELPLDLQTRLLAVLERRMLRRVGSSQERSIRAWFVAATNRDVERMVAEGSLRTDLYFRLNVLSLPLPPLRARGDDVLVLAAHLGQLLARRYGYSRFALEPAAQAALCAYHWPGNVRELKHVMERAMLLANGEALTPAHLLLPSSTEIDSVAAEGGSELFDLTLQEAEKLLIEHALQATANNVSEAARRLGITRMTMRYRMKQHGLNG